MNTRENARMTVHGRALLVRRICGEGWRVIDAARAAVVCLYMARPLSGRRGGDAELSRNHLPRLARLTGEKC